MLRYVDDGNMTASSEHRRMKSIPADTDPFTRSSLNGRSSRSARGANGGVLSAIGAPPPPDEPAGRVIAVADLGCGHGDPRGSTADALLQRVGVLLASVDSAGTIVQAAGALGSCVGPAVVGRPLGQLLHPEDVRALDPDQNPSLATPGSTLTIHARYGSHDRGWKPATVLATNLRGDAAVSGVALVITPADSGGAGEPGLQTAGSCTPSVETLPIPAFTAASDHPDRFAYLGPQISQLVDASPVEFGELGRSWFDVVHPDDRDRVAATWREAGSSRDTARVDYRVVRRDGEVRWVRDERLLRPGAGFEGGQWHGVLLDITERKQAEAERQRAGARFRRLLEQLPAAVYVQETSPNEEERNYLVNKRLEEMLGYSPDEWGTDTDFWSRLLHPDDLDRALVAEQESDAWLGPYRMDYRVRARDGRVFWMRDEARLVEVTPDGRQVWLGVMVDTSEAMSATEALGASERRFRALVQHSHDIIAVVDPDGGHRYVSPSLSPLLGYPPETLGPEDVVTLFHPDDLPRFVEAVAACARSGSQTPPVELRLRHRDGSWRVFEAIGSNLIDDPAVAGIVVNARDVSERRAVERSLRESERRFERFMAISPTPAMIKDREGRYLYANEPFRRMWDRAASTADSTPDRGRAALELVGQIGPVDLRVFDQGVTVEQTETIVGVDGVELEFQTIRFPIELDDDRLVGFVAIDTTERKRAEDAQRLLAAVVNAADDAIVSRAGDGTILSWNPGAERLLGFGAEEMIGQSFDELIPLSRRAEHSAAVERATAGERVGPIESQRLRRDGSAVDVTYTLAPLQDEAGHVVATVAIIHDFTGPKRIREALRRANEDLEERVSARTGELSSLNARLTQNLIKLERAEAVLREQTTALRDQARLLELAHDAIVVRDIASGAIEYWNPSAEAIYGWTTDQAHGQNAHSLLESRFPRPIAEIESRLIAVGHWEGVVEQRRRDGGQITVESRWALRRDDRGAPVAILEINRDATDRVRTERERRELYVALEDHARRVEELAGLKDDFSSIVAHELVTPVAAIRWFVEVLQLGGLTAEEVEQALTTIKAETDLLHLLVDDVRAISKIDSDDYAVGPKPTLLADLLGSAVNYARSLPGNHPFSTEINTEGLVLADPARVGQVLRNLLGNAAKYTPPGTPIVLRAIELPRGARIEVQDEGPGIHVDDVEAIFEKYRRGRQPDGRQVVGAGVGLYVSRRIVQAHGSDLSYRPSRGGGATFAFELRRPGPHETI